MVPYHITTQCQNPEPWHGINSVLSMLSTDIEKVLVCKFLQNSATYAKPLVADKKKQLINGHAHKFSKDKQRDGGLRCKSSSEATQHHNTKSTWGMVT
jgi:hypothetical protein